MTRSKPTLSFDISRVPADTLFAADLEYKLTIAHRIDCWCSEYLVQRRLVLIPAFLEQAQKTGLNVTDVIHRFQQRLHAEKCSTHTGGRVAAFMQRVAEALADEDQEDDNPNPASFWGESKDDDDGR